MANPWAGDVPTWRELIDHIKDAEKEAPPPTDDEMEDVREVFDRLSKRPKPSTP